MLSLCLSETQKITEDDMIKWLLKIRLFFPNVIFLLKTSHFQPQTLKNTFFRDYFINTFDRFNFLLLSPSSSSNSVGCSFSVKPNRGPVREAAVLLLTAAFAPAVAFIATCGCQYCRSINDMMGPFNYLHFSFVVSLPSISKVLVLDGYNKHRERTSSCQGFFFVVLFLYFRVKYSYGAARCSIILFLYSPKDSNPR